MFLKDYERKRLLERGNLALVSDSEEEGEGGGLDKKKVGTLPCCSLLPPASWLASLKHSLHCCIDLQYCFCLCRLRHILKSRRI